MPVLLLDLLRSLHTTPSKGVSCGYTWTILSFPSILALIYLGMLDGYSTRYDRVLTTYVRFAPLNGTPLLVGRGLINRC